MSKAVNATKVIAIESADQTEDNRGCDMPDILGREAVALRRCLSSNCGASVSAAKSM
jgi:hypothetical protein